LITNRVNQAEIARASGLSRQTVSFALNERLRSRLRPETQHIVLSTAKRLGYRPHHYARIMRKGKTGMIGMLQFGGLLQINEKRAVHAARAIHGNGYHLLNHHVLWHIEGVQDALDAIIDARAEGLLLVGPTELVPTSFLDQIKESGMAVVSMAGVRFEGIPQVRCDFRQGMYELTSHLLDLGYRRLALSLCWGSDIHDESHRWPANEKVDGVNDAIRKHGSPDIEFEVSYEDQSFASPAGFQPGRTGMEKILRSSAHPEAVMCANDSWAMGALAASAAAGLQVPQDIAVTGFDDDEVGQFSQPPLTTMAQPVEAMAKRAIELLVKQIRGEKLSAGESLVKMPCQLVVRQSCGATHRSLAGNE